MNDTHELRMNTHYMIQKSFLTVFDGHVTIKMTGPTLGSTSQEHRPYGHLAKTYGTLHDSMQNDHRVSRDAFLAMTFFKKGSKPQQALHIFAQEVLLQIF